MWEEQTPSPGLGLQRDKADVRSDVTDSGKQRLPSLEQGQGPLATEWQLVLSSALPLYFV